MNAQERKSYLKLYRLNNKEKYRKYSQIYRLKFPEKVKANSIFYRKNNKKYLSEYYKRYRSEHLEKIRLYRKSDLGILTRYKSSAKFRKLKFNLTTEHFISLINGNCGYCGTESKPGRKNGIDRKNNSIGYVKENCISCCWECNRIKRETEYSVFVNHLKRIAKFLYENKGAVG